MIQDAAVDPNDGLKQIKKFPPESFDKILLDPPCSALGLRPKLFVAQQSLNELEKHAAYQRKFVQQAVQLLKKGGFMTYSTCTMNVSENECIVNHIMQQYPCMELCPIFFPDGETHSPLGMPGLAGYGLNDKDRLCVCRFDPGNEELHDTMGFFVALFQKKK
jgi:16S rRNA C967 or C1407 C5-methylase (RsmB/RsmF family)